MHIEDIDLDQLNNMGFKRLVREWQELIETVDVGGPTYIWVLIYFLSMKMGIRLEAFPRIARI